MYCNKCGNLLSEGVRFCSNCGNNVEINNNQNSINNVNNNKNDKTGLYTLICGICSIIFAGVIGLILGIASLILRKKETTKSTEGKIGKILAIIGIVLSIVSLCFSAYIVDSIFDFKSNIDEKQENDNYTSDNNNEDTTNKVKGRYSREIFSGNTFDYETGYDKAVFKFKDDSTFEVSYVGGATYKGTYEIYNGLFITVRANEIKEDKTIDKSEELANNIINVSNKMMGNTLLDTYLLWLKTDDGILQPFMLCYDEDTKSGDMVNIYAQLQGKLYLK